jgi:branched-chain amino acid transport system permease protein
VRLASIGRGWCCACSACWLGFFLRAIRDNEDAAQGLGVNLLRNKMLAMTISAVLTSLVGTVFARYLSFVDPYMLAAPTLTIEIVLLATIGGLGTPFGPVLGALLLVPLGEILRGQLGGVLPGLHLFLYGLAVVVVVLALPRGIAPALATLARRLRPNPIAPRGAARKVRP